MRGFSPIPLRPAADESPIRARRPSITAMVGLAAVSALLLRPPLRRFKPAVATGNTLENVFWLAEGG